MIENRPHVIKPCVDPWTPTKTPGPAIVDWKGRRVCASYGMHEDGYDIRLQDPVTLIAGYTIVGLALEHLTVPKNMRVRVDDKSTNLRLGIRVAGRAAPGWHGHLTLELLYVPIIGGPSILEMPAEWGIGTLEFGCLTQEGDYGPDGKYQGAMEIQSAR